MWVMSSALKPARSLAQAAPRTDVCSHLLHWMSPHLSEDSSSKRMRLAREYLEATKLRQNMRMQVARAGREATLL